MKNFLILFSLFFMFFSTANAQRVVRADILVNNTTGASFAIPVDSKVPVTNGGTGLSTIASGSILVGQGASAPVQLAPGAIGNVLTSDGSTWTSAVPQGGGSVGINTVINSDFESLGLLNWNINNATVSRQTYSQPTSSNRYYAQITSTQAGGYYETDPLYVPNILAGGDLQVQAFAYPVSGTWAIQSLSGTTVVASQTISAGTNFAKTPIMFNPAGAVSTPMKVRFAAVSAGAVLAIDNVYKGEAINLKNGAIVSPWQTYTQNCGGTWTTNTTYSCRKRQVGENMEYEYFITLSGAPNATPLFLNTDTIDFNKMASIINNFSLGLATFDDAGVQTTGGVVGLQSINQVIPLVNNSAGTNAVPSTVNATNPFTWGNGDRLTARFVVPIVGLSGTGTTFDSACPNDATCTNDFAAQLTSAGAVSNLNVPSWITCDGANPQTCTFQSGLFTGTSAPNCTVTPIAGGQVSVHITSLSQTSIVMRSASGADNSLVAVGKTIKCSRTSDFVAKRTIEGFLSKQVTSTGNFIERMERVSVATTCSSTPCTISSNSGAFTSITFVSAGRYIVNYNSNTWSAGPTCTITTGAIAVGEGAYAAYVTRPSTASFEFITPRGSTGAPTNNNFDIICVGPR